MELIKIPSFPAKIETIFENEKRIAINPKKIMWEQEPTKHISFFHSFPFRMNKIYTRRKFNRPNVEFT